MKQSILSKTHRVVDELGVENQLPIWVEELSELAKELCKWQRIYKQVGTNLDITLRYNILSELTDVENALEQIRHALGFTIEEQECEFIFKVNRTIEKELGQNE